VAILSSTGPADTTKVMTVLGECACCSVVESNFPST
jgi:hypothetical protein